MRVDPPRWSHRTVATASSALHVREWGDPSRPTVVLVHGYPDSSVVWDDVAAALGTDHHVVAYDVRGIGRSAAPTGPHPYRLAHLADDLVAVIDAVDPHRPVHVAGHDWGSVQAWEAVTDPARRQRIASFTSISGPCLDHVAHAVRSRLRRPSARAGREVLRQGLRSSYILFLCTPGVATAIWHVGADRAWRHWLRRMEGVAVDDRHPSLAADGRQGVHLYRANIGRALARPRERTTDVPVLLLTLTRDRYVTPTLTDDLERWATLVTRRSLDAGHWAPRSHPDEVASLVAEHVAAVEHRRRPA